MKINITPLFIERGKAEAASVQLSISNDNLDNLANVQCAYYDAEDLLLKIEQVALAEADYTAYVAANRSNEYLKTFVLNILDLEEANN